VEELIDFLAGHLKADEAIALSGENALLAFEAVDVRLKLQRFTSRALLALPVGQFVS
jgi:hypothetical protein